MAFFQRPTEYPCQLILDPQNDYETLRRRVEQTTLKAQTVNRNRSGVTNVSLAAAAWTSAGFSTEKQALGKLRDSKLLWFSKESAEEYKLHCVGKTEAISNFEFSSKHDVLV